MATGERIRYLRTLRAMTQKQLGIEVGFPERTADIRLAQYESGTRTPKEDIVERIADVLDVSPASINVPDIDSYVGLMHTLFALEDLYGFKIDELNNEVCIRIDKSKGSMSLTLFDYLSAWQKESKRLRDGQTTKEEYDTWRYHFPEHNAQKFEAELYNVRKKK